MSPIIQTLIILATYIHTITSKIITCDNEDGCDWKCSNDKSCEDDQYHCPSNIEKCSLTCIHCESIKIYSSAPYFTLSCTGAHGCDGINITSETASSHILLSCEQSESCSDITFSCPQPSNCKCIETNDECSNDNIEGDYSIEKKSETHIQYSTTPIIISEENNTSIYTQQNTTIPIEIYSDLPHSNRDSTILNIVLSSALLFTIIACVYMFINKMKSKANRKQTDESNTHQMDLEYSEVNIDVNRLNSSVQSPRPYKPHKKNSEGFAFTKGSYVKNSTSVVESMYGEENNIIEHTPGKYTKRSNKLSNTASEGNMDGLYEKSKDDSDDNQLLYGKDKGDNDHHDPQFVAQAAPIIAYDNEIINDK